MGILFLCELESFMEMPSLHQWCSLSLTDVKYRACNLDFLWQYVTDINKKFPHSQNGRLATVNVVASD